MSIVLIFLSCLFRNVEIEKTLPNTDLEQIQRLWDKGEYDKFPEIIDKLVKKNNDPIALLGFGAAMYAQRGRVEFSQADLEIARRFGFRCLSEDKSFSSLVNSNGGQITRQAIEALDEANPLILDCAQWTTISWALWLHERGPQGASYDIDVVRSMASWVFRYRTEPWTHYAVAISDSLRPVYEFPNWKKIQKHFEQSRSIDSLVEHELQFYVLRHIDGDSYCRYQPSESLSAVHKERFIDSRYYCANRSDEE